MGVFPSGQRGQTVNLLSLTSVVRIHPLPPEKSIDFVGAFSMKRSLSGTRSKPTAVIKYTYGTISTTSCKAKPCTSVKILYHIHKVGDDMNKFECVDLIASACLIIGSIIQIVEIFIDVNFIISVIAIVLILSAVFLWLVVLKRMKKNKSSSK